MLVIRPFLPKIVSGSVALEWTEEKGSQSAADQICEIFHCKEGSREFTLVTDYLATQRDTTYLSIVERIAIRVAKIYSGLLYIFGASIQEAAYNVYRKGLLETTFSERSDASQKIEGKHLPLAFNQPYTLMPAWQCEFQQMFNEIIAGTFIGSAGGFSSLSYLEKNILFKRISRQQIQQVVTFFDKHGVSLTPASKSNGIQAVLSHILANKALPCPYTQNRMPGSDSYTGTAAATAALKELARSVITAKFETVRAIDIAPYVEGVAYEFTKPYGNPNQKFNECLNECHTQAQAIVNKQNDIKAIDVWIKDESLTAKQKEHLPARYKHMVTMLKEGTSLKDVKAEMLAEIEKISDRSVAATEYLEDKLGAEELAERAESEVYSGYPDAVLYYVEAVIAKSPTASLRKLLALAVVDNDESVLEALIAKRRELTSAQLA